MKVGIVVPTLNRIDKTSRFLKLIERQTFKDYKLFIIDSGSNDGTREFVAKFNRVDITLIEATLDDWWAHCTNLGVKAALRDGCDVILTINDDAIIMPDYLESFLRIFKKNNLNILANRIDFAHNPGKIWALGSYSVWGTPWLFQLWQHEVWENQLPEDVMNKQYIISQATCGDGVLIDKEVFEKIGFYDERNCPQYHADTEFTLRAARSGYEVYVTPHVILYNDIFNENTNNTALNKSKIRLMFELLFNKKSEIYFRSVSKIAFSEAGFVTGIATVAKYYAFRLHSLLFAETAEMLRQTSGQNLIHRVIYRVIKLFAKWVFDFNVKSNSKVTMLKDKNALKHIEKYKKAVDSL